MLASIDRIVPPIAGPVELRPPAEVRTVTPQQPTQAPPPEGIAAPENNDALFRAILSGSDFFADVLSTNSVRPAPLLANGPALPLAAFSGIWTAAASPGVAPAANAVPPPPLPGTQANGPTNDPAALAAFAGQPLAAGTIGGLGAGLLARSQEGKQQEFPRSSPEGVSSFGLSSGGDCGASVPVGWVLEDGGVAELVTEGIGYAGSRITPTEGTFMLRLSTQGSTPTDTYTNDQGEPGTAGTIVRSPTAQLAAGTVVSLDWYFTTDDYIPYHDFALGMVSGNQLFRFTLHHSEDPDTNYDSGWHSASWTVPTTGEYQLVLVVSDEGDEVVDTDLYLDRVTGFSFDDTIRPCVTIAATDPDAAEAGPDPGLFTVYRTGPTTTDLTVNYTVGGTASRSDYQEVLSGSVTIPAGAAEATIPLTPVDDDLGEADETVVLTLTSGTDYVVGNPDSATVTIANDDVTVTVSATDPVAAEEGLDPGQFTVTRTGPTDLDLVVSLVIGGTAGDPDDYSLSNYPVTIPAGFSSTTFDVLPVDDDLAEGDETVTARVSGTGDPAIDGYTFDPEDEAVVTIRDNEPTVTLYASDPEATEPASGPADDTGAWTVERTGSTAEPLTVSYIVDADSTATEGTDYAPLSRLVTIPAGENRATILLDPLADSDGLEGDETVTLVLQPGSDYTVGEPDRGTVTIHPLSVSVTASVPTTYERPGAAPGAFTFTRSGGLNSTLTVTYRLGGTATPGADYDATPLSGSITFNPSEQSKVVPVAPLEDALTEGNETVTVTLEPGSGYALAGEATATVTIVDTIVTLTASPDTTTEGGISPGTFMVSRQGDFAEPLAVTYTLRGLAINGWDYRPLEGAVTLPAGAASAAFDVVALRDGLVEGDEDVVAALQPFGNHYEVGTPGTATVLIRDADQGDGTVVVERRTWDPLAGLGWEQTGNVRLMHGLDLDNSPGTSQSLDPALVYNSDSVTVRPIFHVSIPSNPLVALPPQIVVELTWDAGGPREQVATRTFSTSGFLPGQVFTAAIQTDLPVEQTGRYRWRVRVTLDYPEPQTDPVATTYGSDFVVVQDDSPYGAGWTFAMLDRLYDIPALEALEDPGNPGQGWPAEVGGKLRAYGTGGWRFYADNGDGTFASPAGDSGRLVFDAGVGAYRYTSADGQRWWFNAAGLQTAWESADGQAGTTYTYADADGDGAFDDLIAATAIDGAVAGFTYVGGRLTGIDGVAGHNWLLSHTGLALTGITNPDGGVRALGYNAQLKLTGVVDAGYYTQAWSYGADGAARSYRVGQDPATQLTPAAVFGLAGLALGLPRAVVTDPRGSSSAWLLDQRGRPLLHLDAAGQPWRWQRDPSTTYVTAFSDPLGRTVTYQRDALGHVLAETFPDGTTRRYTWANVGTADRPRWRPTSFTNERNFTWNYGYDPGGHLTSVDDPTTNLPTVYTYYPSGLLETVTDPRRVVTRYRYDAQRRLSRIIAADNAPNTRTWTDLTYDAAGNIATVTDGLADDPAYAHPSTTAFLYDPLDRPTVVTEGYGTALARDTVIDYDPAGFVTQVQAAGQATAYAYDRAGRPTQVVEASGSGMAQTTVLTYDAAGNVATVLAPGGLLARYVYDERNQVTFQTAAEGTPAAVATRFGYDAAGRPVWQVDSQGMMTVWQYDRRDRVTARIEASGVTGLAQLWQYGYDAAGNRTAQTDPLAHTVLIAYDPLNRPIQVTDALGHYTLLAYDAGGNVSAVTDARGYETRYTYDALGRLMTATEAYGTPAQRTSALAYDAASNVVAHRDPLNQLTTLAYDALNRNTAVTVAAETPAAQTWQQFYDPRDRLVLSVDPTGRPTWFGYDALDRVVQVIDAQGRSHRTGYDAQGNVAWTADPLGNVTRYSYDLLGRLTAIVDANGGLTQLAYDTRGQLVALRDPVGNVTRWRYDLLGREVERIDPLGQSVCTTYDLANRATAITDRLGRRREFSYDNANRLTAETWRDRWGNVVDTLSYGYDPAGNL
ncbi:MAG TPA: Calx-beta domain-containing protein, partial [Gemmataceae bacterium]|nr:Calx-beta domain-containing protein [Gemmataceae bacterium]